MDKSPKSKSCKHPGCRKKAKFNYEGETQGLYCKDHMLPGMIDVVNKKCEHTGCRKRPKFNYDGEKKGLYCKDHMLPGMVNVKSRKCEHPGCKKRPYFNYEVETKGLYCKEHMLPGMVNVVDKNRCNNNPKCEYNDCNEISVYTDDNTNYPKRCDKDKNIDKYKETVKEFLLSKGITFESQDGCSNRPDFVIDYGKFKVIIEVDENQHSECEYRRMYSIHSDFGGVPILFLRYNPDIYHIKGETIRRNDNYRLTKLFEVLTQLKNVEIIKYPLLVCYLFYDEFDGTLRFYTIDYYNNDINEVQDVFEYKKS
jgi:hypothetical protein